MVLIPVKDTRFFKSYEYISIRLILYVYCLICSILSMYVSAANSEVT